MSSQNLRLSAKNGIDVSATRSGPSTKRNAAAARKNEPSAKGPSGNKKSTFSKAADGGRSHGALKRKASATQAESKAKVPKKGAALAEVVKQVVSIWEDLRTRDASAEHKQDLVAKIIKLARGKINELAVKSKASRVVQAMLKHGTKPQQDVVWNECKDHIVQLSMSPYGNHVVRKLISVADSDQLSDLYDKLQTAGRNALVAEFYSREIALLGPKASTATLSSLVDAWPEMDGPQRRSTMQRLIHSLQPILEKAYVDPPPIHRLVSEYMQLAPSDMVQDCVESLTGEAVMRMVHTHDGCRVGCMVAAYSTPKQRKKIVKGMKGHVTQMCADEFAYITLIKVLAAVDDTELVRKTIITEIQSSLADVVASRHGIKVLLSLVSSSSKHLPPHAQEMLSPPQRAVATTHGFDTPGEAGESLQDGEPAQTVLGLSKKGLDRKRQELVGSGSNSLGMALLRHCTTNAAELLQTAHGGDLVACISGDSSMGQVLWDADNSSVVQLHEAIAAAAAGSEGKGVPLLEHFFASRALKRMALAKSGEASKSCARTLWNHAVKHKLKDFVNTHAAKVVAALAQGDPDVSQDVRSSLQSAVTDVDTWLASFSVNKRREGKD